MNKTTTNLRQLEQSTNTTPDNVANNQPTVNKRLDEILTKLENAVALNIGSQGMRGEAPKRSHWKAKQAINSLFKELVAEAKPHKRLPDDSPTADEDLVNYGYNEAINQFEQNLLKALEEV